MNQRFRYKILLAAAAAKSGGSLPYPFGQEKIGSEMGANRSLGSVDKKIIIFINSTLLVQQFLTKREKDGTLYKTDMYYMIGGRTVVGTVTCRRISGMRMCCCSSSVMIS